MIINNSLYFFTWFNDALFLKSFDVNLMKVSDDFFYFLSAANFGILKEILIGLELWTTASFVYIFTETSELSLTQSGFQSGPETAPLVTVSAGYCHFLSPSQATSSTCIDISKKVFHQKSFHFTITYIQ